MHVGHVQDGALFHLTDGSGEWLSESADDGDYDDVAMAIDHEGNVAVASRSSPNSLYDEATVTFEDDAGAYDQRDAEGFIKLNALRLKLRKL